MKDQILSLVLDALASLEIEVSEEQKAKITITSPDPKLGDFATNASLILAKSAGKKPKGLAEEIVSKIDQSKFESVSIAGVGFINFRLKNEELLKLLDHSSGLRPPARGEGEIEKILLEYFQPNIAKPLHIGHLRTAIIGDAIKRMMLYTGQNVESDTHMGDWGTQFGVLILAYKKYGDPKQIEKDPITELNKLYIQINREIEKDPELHEQAKLEFVKLEQGDEENKKIWKQFVDWSLEKFLKINDLLDILPFDHHWPESFYEDRMPEVVAKLKKKKLLKKSKGAQIVNLSAYAQGYGGSAEALAKAGEKQNLGIAVIIKSDSGTTYLLRDLATFIFAKQQGFAKHFYVVDSRQSHHYKQLFAILKLMGEMEEGEGEHIDYGFISFKGEALSTRKGNMVLAEDVLAESRKRVAKIIREKNPDLADKEKVIRAVSIGALKYYDLSHNRHSDFEFDWEEALDFEGNSGPYLQYAYARLSGILNKVNLQGKHDLTGVSITSTERELILKIISLPDVVSETLKGYLPNILANYLYEFASLVNKFYHESPVAKEENERVKYFRLNLIKSAQNSLKQGFYLLGIEALEEM